MSTHDDTGLVARRLGDIAHLLESVEGGERRLRGALELLGKIVPYRQSALLEGEPGSDPRLLAVPPMPEDDQRDLAVALVKLFGKLLQEHALPQAPARGPWASHLAVPLIGNGEMIGVLFVNRADGTYGSGDLRVLSLVAAQLAAYLMVLRASNAMAARGREREEGRREALRTKAAAARTLADEIRAPLEAASAWLRVLSSGTLSPAERARAIEAVERSMRTQDRLVRDIFDVSSIAGLRLELASLRPAGLIEAAVEEVRPLAEQRSIRLETSLDGTVGALVGDAARLDEVLAILLANAFRSTPDGGRVQVRLEHDGAGARVRVTDSGKGFSPGGLAHVFDAALPEAIAAHGPDGFEIGLAIARHLVELHGGTLRVDSEGEGQGATFTMDLPTPFPAPSPG